MQYCPESAQKIDCSSTYFCIPPFHTLSSFIGHLFIYLFIYLLVIYLLFVHAKRNRENDGSPPRKKLNSTDSTFPNVSQPYTSLNGLHTICKLSYNSRPCKQIKYTPIEGQSQAFQSFGFLLFINKSPTLWLN